MQPPPARYIMIGGFLGSGKTTSILRLARWLTHRGHSVGLIDNDQGSRLVDTALIQSNGFPVEEISGGCFCCRFNSLIEAATRLEARARPSMFLAEPVGSCTDLVATVTYPLRRIYGQHYTIAPLSVLVDPLRALRILGLDSGARFTPKVEYIYRKQLEEADLIIVNKMDLLAPLKLDTLKTALAREFPRAEILAVSSRSGNGLDPWFDRLLHDTQAPRPIMEVDYNAYAEGEALLGWLNASYSIQSPRGIDASQLLRSIAERVRNRFASDSSEIAHFKMTLEPEDGFGALAAIHVVRNDFVPELSAELEDPLHKGNLTVNMRAEAAPGRLQDHLRNALLECAPEFPGLELREVHAEAFRPGKPEPTHRVTA